MRRATVVIGANFGDEGKGLVTDFYANRHGKDGLVVRFNSGPQAGHTIVTPDGRRHVFSHFGSGSFCGTPTYLSRFFVSNPLLFSKELTRLKEKGVMPIVYADKDGLVTTPYDMIINQIVEVARGDGRHGSCGVGFGETIERSQHPEFTIRVGDLLDDDLAGKLDDIRRTWVRKRMRKLRIKAPYGYDNNPYILNDSILQGFLDEAAAFRKAVNLCDIAIIRDTKKQIIFEGAQGLLLDEDHRWFPHVTRSKTGLQNVVALAREAGLDGLNVTYVTRAYLTRHGAGPLPNELPGVPYPNVVDETNIKNLYQGGLRFAYLDLDLLAQSITHDLASAGSFPVRHKLAITCLDQVGSHATYHKMGKERVAPTGMLIDIAMQAVGASEGLAWHGPTRDDASLYSPTLLDA